MRAKYKIIYTYCITILNDIQNCSFTNFNRVFLVTTLASPGLLRNKFVQKIIVFSIFDCHYLIYR